jgi:hypothetical protein
MAMGRNEIAPSTGLEVKNKLLNKYYSLHLPVFICVCLLSSLPLSLVQ